MPFINWTLNGIPLKPIIYLKNNTLYITHCILINGNTIFALPYGKQWAGPVVGALACPFLKVPE